MKVFRAQFFYLSIFIMALFACKNDQYLTPKTGTVKFGLPNNGNSDGRIASIEPSAVLVTIVDSEGNLVAEGQRLSIYAFGSNYISEGLKLSSGSYRLVEFFVLDDSDKIIFVAPLEGSEKAELVDQPLPIDFLVTESGSTEVVPQVLAIEPTDIPESFGYVSFGFEIVDYPVSSKRLKEIWMDEFNDGQIDGKVTMTYADNKMSKAEFYYRDLTEWMKSGEANYSYDEQGRLVEKITTESFSGFKQKWTYSYDSDLKEVKYFQTYSGVFPEADRMNWKFFYDADGSLASGTLTDMMVEYDYEYEVNSNGDIEGWRQYVSTSEGIILKYESSYTFDNSLNTLGYSTVFNPFPRYGGFGHIGMSQMHNISSQRTTYYNSSDGQLVESYVCDFSVEYEKNADDLITKAIFHVPPTSCWESNGHDGDAWIYIYE